MNYKTTLETRGKWGSRIKAGSKYDN